MVNVVQNALAEYRTTAFGRDKKTQNKFTRKLHTACALGMISREELDQITQGMKQMIMDEMEAERKRRKLTYDDLERNYYQNLVGKATKPYEPN